VAIIHSEAPTIHRPERRNLWFAISSVALLAGAVWLFYADYNRQWKTYQRQFRQIELDRARQAIADLEARYAADTELQQLHADLEAARQVLQGQTGDLREAEGAVAAAAEQFWLAETEWKVSKSFYDAAKYQVEEARERNRGVARAEEHYRETEERFRAAVLELEKATTSRDDASAALKALGSGVSETERKIGSLTELKTRLERKVNTIGPNLANALRDQPIVDFLNPSIRVKQVQLPNLFNDVNFLKIPKVDRCVTCHLAAPERGFEELAHPFRSHPNLDLMLGEDSPHPYSEFGCTSCHQGLDRATYFLSAQHTPGDEEQRHQWEREHGWHQSHYWDDPMLPTEHTEAACLKCHRREARIGGAPRLNRALDTLESAGCYGCHKIQGFEELRKTGPDLGHLPSKVSRDWAHSWISDPREFRPTTWMPKFFHLSNTSSEGDQIRNAVEIDAILEYIWGNSSPLDLEQPPVRGDAERGRMVLAEKGCRGCHRIGENTTERRASGRDFGPALDRVGDKLGEPWLYTWVKNPKKIFPDTYMPDLRLTDQEAADAASYLTTLRKAPAPPAPPTDEAVLDEVTVEYLRSRLTASQAEARLASMDRDEKLTYLGEKLINRYGCFGCHNIPGFEDALPIGTELTREGSKLVARLDFGHVELEHTRQAWFFQKLKEPRIFDHGRIKAPQEKLKMPDFGFTDEEARAMVTFLLGLTKDEPLMETVNTLDPREAALEAGRRVVQARNCRGCHVIEGTGGWIRETIEDPGYYPPDLIGEGAKVQSDWLFSFLKRPATIRPWLHTRMPTFDLTDEEAVTLGRYFAALDDALYPFESDTDQPVPAAQVSEGRRWFTAFKCLQCHVLDASSMQGLTAADLAPDLTLARDRLRRDWIIDWLTDPQKEMPGTRMPSFFYSDGDPLMDEPDAKIEAIRDYLMVLGGSPGRQGSRRASSGASGSDRPGP
jgi:cbb3-type cytochrome oxidase cytochrome c subunit